MIELFPNVPNYIRQQTNYFLNKAFAQHSAIEAIKIIEMFRNTLPEQEWKDYFDFSYELKKEEVKNNNESISD